MRRYAYLALLAFASHAMIACESIAVVFLRLAAYAAAQLKRLRAAEES